MSNTPTIPETPEAKASADKKLTSKEWAVVLGNIALAAIALVLFGFEKISVEFLGLVLLATGFPSAAGIIANKLRKTGGDGGATAFLLFSLATMSIGAAVVGCAGLASAQRAAESAARVKSYDDELVACSAEAGSLRESIDCENGVRRRYPLPDGAPRPLRDAGGAR